MKKEFYAVYCVNLDEKEIEQVVELDIIDDNDRFEEFCFQSKNRELVGIFKSSLEAEDFIFMIDDDDKEFVKLSDPVYIVKQIEIEVNENVL